MTAGHLDSLRRIAPLAWPVFVGQLAVLAFSTIDTMLIARHSATDLAALAVGAAIYMTVFIGLMGVMLAISPIVGQLYGAGKLEAAGDQLHQSVWLGLALMLIGEALLLFPEPFLALSRTAPEVESKVRGYLLALACSLPASLLFTAYRGFNTAVSRPKMVMALQIGGLALKVPLTLLLIRGAAPLNLPALGAVGCGISTAIVMWAQTLIAFALLRRDPFYARFGLQRGGLHAPRPAALRAFLRLGLPMGASILVEVTGFTFMAIFIARIGATAVAGHQLAANLVTLLFMAPLSLANATGTLVAQRVGAHDAADARRIGWHGLEIAVLIAALLGALVFLAREQVLRLYTQDPVIVAAALPLLLWVGAFHIGDAAQTMAAQILRAHHIATAPLIIYALAIWGVGIGGGYFLAFSQAAWLPASLRGPAGFWSAATAGLILAALGLSAFLAWVHKQEAQA
ncbi:MATE family efflux transporter [Roseateles violae]|uniref:MATE family efflux transporter n=1 Tax=Roseateles violae TaxID=3058042 RepID=A0ABT8DU80_9BURK|nr:MATE family efflux transporter [Pelomonas sp. PFR6]MDN3921860.1 MATE family efflux transporter [Pelomonas sp. PFR6]